MEKINFQNLPSTSTPLNSTNLNQMQDNMEDAIIPIKLVTISDSAPSTATIGDMYYNTTDNKVYTATGTNTWDSGSTPRYDGFYINTSNNTLFYYNGSTLIGVGGSSSGIGGDTLPVGMIMPGAFSSTMVVEDWLKCDGSAVSRTEYSELFSAIGVSYGNGDGSTTFNLPNIKGKMIIGYDPDDNDFDTMGAIGGSKTHTQTIEEMPSHNHSIPNSYLDNRTDGSVRQTGTGSYISRAGSNTNNTGGGQPMDIMNPYIVMNYYIKSHQTAPVTATVKNEETTSETDVYSCNYINNNKAFESGSNDLGNYIKYSDGTMIQYQRYATTVGINGNWGSLFFGSVSCPDYPQPFVNTEPTVTASIYPTTESWCLGNLVYSSDKQQNLLSAGTVMCIRPQSTNSLPVVIEIIAIGRWK